MLESFLHGLTHCCQEVVEGNTAVLTVSLVLKEHCLGNLLTDTHDGVKGRKRILEDHRDLVTAELVHILLGDLEKILTVVENFTVLVNGVNRGNTHNCLRSNRLTGTGLTNNCKSLSLVKIKGDVSYSLNLSCIGTEGHS